MLQISTTPMLNDQVDRAPSDPRRPLPPPSVVAAARTQAGTASKFPEEDSSSRRDINLPPSDLFSKSISPPLSAPVLGSLPLLSPYLICAGRRPLCLGWKAMELLLLELLLTMVLSVLVTFLLRKVVAVGASDEGYRDGSGAAEEAAEPLVSGAAENSTDEAKEVIGRGVTGSAEEEKVLMTDEAGRPEKVALAPTPPPCPDGEKEMAEESDTSEQRLIGDEADNVKIGPCGMSAEERLESQDGGPSIGISSDIVRLSVSDDGEWEGIEKSDLEKLFASATAFVAGEEGGGALAELSNDLQMQLHGLYKIATEGPCYESQPLSLNLSARAKWYQCSRFLHLERMILEVFNPLFFSCSCWPRRHTRYEFLMSSRSLLFFKKSMVIEPTYMQRVRRKMAKVSQEQEACRCPLLGDLQLALITCYDVILRPFKFCSISAYMLPI